MTKKMYNRLLICAVPALTLAAPMGAAGYITGIIGFWASFCTAVICCSVLVAIAYLPQPKKKKPCGEIPQGKRNEKITVLIITEHEGVVKSEKIHAGGF